MDTLPIENKSAIDKITDFLYSKKMLFLCTLVTIVSFCFSLDFYCAIFYFLIGEFVLLFCKDFLPATSLFLYGYIFVSRSNNPGANANSIFSMSNYGIPIVCLLGIVVVTAIIKIYFYKKTKSSVKLFKEGSLSLSFVILGATFICSGLFAKGYTTICLKNILFALVEFASFFGLYMIMIKTIDWDNVPKHYFSYIIINIGITICAEILFLFLTENIIDGGINRDNIYTGWGMYNNIGALLCVCIPGASYLASRSKHAFVYNILSSIFVLFVFATCSRTSMICAVLLYIASSILTIIFSKDKSIRLQNIITYASTVILGLIVLIVFYNYFINIFNVLIERGLDLSGREEVYETAFGVYLKNIVFGGSFYSNELFEMNNFWYWGMDSLKSVLPPRWHNSILQVMASCGTVGLLAYLYHRFKTIKLMLKHRSLEKTFICITIIGILFISLFDCMLFNIAPAFLYSMALAFIEKNKSYMDKSI